MDDTGILFLSRRDLVGLLRPPDYLAAVEAGFRAAAQGRARSPAPLHLAAGGGGFHGKGALIEREDCSYAAVKLNGNFPANPARGLPTIQGVIILSDAGTGTPLAIMDSIEITLRRTAAATALAASFLARQDATRIALCGCGAQALPHLDALAEVFAIGAVQAWDQDEARMQALARMTRERSALEVRAASSLRDATLNADIIITCTTATEPFLGREEVSPGAFVGAVGADAPHKSEVKPDLMRDVGIFVDVIDQCAVMGDLHHAIAAGVVEQGDVRGDLAQLVTGACQGRRNEQEVVVFDSTGTAIEDVVSAALAFERATACGAGKRLNLND